MIWTNEIQRGYHKVEGKLAPSGSGNLGEPPQPAQLRWLAREGKESPKVLSPSQFTAMAS
jgi:hypothetical protein